MSPGPNVDVREQALLLESLTKTYGRSKALDGVGFSVARGSVHGLVGGNGSGKSTLIKSLAGVVRPDSGRAVIFGEQLDLASGVSTARIRKSGLRFVHQQSSVFPDMTVTENLALGGVFERGPLGGIRWRDQRVQAQRVLDRFGIKAAPGDRVGRLRPAVQATIAIARALDDLGEDRNGLLVLDEPTASLPPAEVQFFLGEIRRYAAEGHSIIFVSHRPDEILSVTDSLTVLRDGTVRASVETSELDHTRLIELIAGRALMASYSEHSTAPSGTGFGAGLEVSGLSGGGLREATFSVRHGEIVGLGGLLGSGRSSLLRLLFGVLPAATGTVRLDGRDVQLGSVDAAMQSGIAMVPEDRTTESVFSDLSVAENLSIASLDHYFVGGRLRVRRQRSDASALISDYGIKCGGPNAPIRSLSGGNQQKVILARWIRRSPSVLLLDEPTHGVDVGARADIYQFVRAAAAQGTCVLVVSSDADELEALCDRVLVLKEGRLVASLDTATTTDSDLEKII